MSKIDYHYETIGRVLSYLVNQGLHLRTSVNALSSSFPGVRISIASPVWRLTPRGAAHLERHRSHPSQPW